MSALELNPRLKTLAWVHIVLNGVCLLAGTALCISLISEEQGAWKVNADFLFVGMIFLALAAVYFLPGFIGGMGLLHGRRWGRILLIIESVVLILVFPLGTILGGFGLFVLLRPEPAGPDSRQPVFSRPSDRIEQPVMPAADDSLVTCPHLQPVESGMLKEGILLGRITRLQVRAYCVIEEARFRLRYPNFLPAPVIACDRCHSVIEAVPPDAAVPETPLFPRT